MQRLLETLLILVVLIGLAVAAFYSLLSRSEADLQTVGSVHSEEPDGGAALQSWLSEAGYHIRTLTHSPLMLSASDHVLFVLAPGDEYTALELRRLDGWLESGGALVVAQQRRAPGQLLSHYGVRVTQLSPPVERASPCLPALNWPIVGQAEVRASARLVIGRDDAAIHIGDCNTPILAAFSVGSGQVLVASTVYPFTNDGLRDPGNAQLVSNLVSALAAPDRSIVFDEAHRNTGPAVSFLPWLTSTAEGWGALYAVVVLGATAVLSLRPFGTVVVPAERGVRPTLADFSLMTAGLQSRTGWHTIIRYHYWERLRRTLIQRYRLDPALSDDELLERLAPHQDEVDLASLVCLVAEMRGRGDGQMSLAEWVEAIIKWQQEFEEFAPVGTVSLG